jgi:ribosome biogenesis GTPase
VQLKSDSAGQWAGRILKGVGGFYYVLDDAGTVHECKARGRFRLEGITPLPGDMVRFSPQKDSYGFIEEILPRRNELKRPRVANIDIAAIVASAHKPLVDKLLCDKLVIHLKRAGIRPLLVINKCDVAAPEAVDALEAEYRNVCPIVRVSAFSGEGLPALKAALSGCCTCFAGQSATGKSSLLNALFPHLSLETGGLSRKVDRGRHTTRHAELMVLDDFSGTVVDTPGFSFLEPESIQPEELGALYSDFESHASGCRFTGCLHDKEPGCGVKEAVLKGIISEGRYQRYLTILKELQEMKEKRYD